MITIVLFLILLIYSVSVGLLIFGFTKVNTIDYIGLKPKTAFTIIVPFRDEAENLPILLESLSKLQYPTELVDVLLVDDDNRNSYALSKVMIDKELNVLIADNGENALKMLKDNPSIDLVLRDIMMPIMDGLTAIEQIRKTLKMTKIPVIALTAKAMKEDRNKCINAGANDYMSKPIEMDKLINLLRVWLY